MCKKKLSTLEDFVHFVDDEFDLSSFADVLVICARDVVIKHATKDICIKKFVHFLLAVTAAYFRLWNQTWHKKY